MSVNLQTKERIRKYKEFNKLTGMRQLVTVTELFFADMQNTRYTNAADSEPVTNGFRNIANLHCKKNHPGDKMKHNLLHRFKVFPGLLGGMDTIVAAIIIWFN